MKFRNAVGELSSFVLGELRGIDETIQYGAGEKKKKAIYDKSVNLAKIQKELAEAEGRQRGFTNGAIQLFSYGMLLLTLILYSNSIIEFEAVVICTVAMMSSFGPVVALSALSNNLNQTLASGERVLALLEEEPEVVEEPKVEEPEKELKPVEEKKVEPEKLCTTKVKPEELPQMVMVFDNSPSMLSSLNESDAAMNEFWARWARNLSSIEENRHMLRAPNRLTVAKKAAASIINNVAPNVPIGFVTLSSCPSAHNHGFYGQSKRGALKSAISNIFPFVDRSTYDVLPNRQTGTPLYSGLQQAAAMVDGKNKEAFILLISDGENSCDKDQDVCALAAQIARQKPRLKINVVDIGGAKGANCVAHATKGKVFTANNQKQISSMINQAVKPMQTEEVCK